MKKGISLAVLVVTIIVLVILTAATVATITGENGVIDEARLAAEDTKRQNAEDTIQMEIAAIQIKAAKAGQTVGEYIIANSEAITTQLNSKGIEFETETSGNIKFTYNEKYSMVIDTNGKKQEVEEIVNNVVAGTTYDKIICSQDDMIAFLNSTNEMGNLDEGEFALLDTSNLTKKISYKKIKGVSEDRTIVYACNLYNCKIENVALSKLNGDLVLEDCVLKNVTISVDSNVKLRNCELYNCTIETPTTGSDAQYANGEFTNTSFECCSFLTNGYYIDINITDGKTVKIADCTFNAISKEKQATRLYGNGNIEYINFDLSNYSVNATTGTSLFDYKSSDVKVYYEGVLIYHGGKTEDYYLPC